MYTFFGINKMKSTEKAIKVAKKKLIAHTNKQLNYNPQTDVSYNFT